MRKRIIVGLGAVALLAGGIAAVNLLRPTDTPPAYQGWVEADLVFVSPDEIGRVTTLSVREGSTVKAGDPLFTLDDDLQRAAVAENEASVINAKQAYDRAKELLKRAVTSQKVFDDAEALLRTAEAKLNSSKTRLDRRRMLSPVEGTVQEVYFRVGELVSPGRPIVSIMPPGNIKVRFFVPQAVLPSIHLGDRVLVHCDGCPTDLYAHISFISAQAEFTPPVIYSLEERARLVFRVEALPERPEKLRIGQPSTVALSPPIPNITKHADKHADKKDIGARP